MDLFQDVVRRPNNLNQQIIFHIDVNSAYLSWTAAHRIHHLGQDQDLRQIPSAIAGDIKTRHGIILAKSIPAQKCGVKTGDPIFIAQKKCPDLLLAPPDYGLYVQCSHALMELLREFSSRVEQYSIDEAWMDISHSHLLFGSPVATADFIREKVLQELGFTINIGVSSNHLLAKMASGFQKPFRTHTLFPEEIPQKLWPLPVSKLFYVGRATEKKLRALGIQTIGELANTDPHLLKTHFKKHGEVIHNFANGMDQDLLNPHILPNKGYGNSMTVPYDVTTFAQARPVLLSLCETVCARLRADDARISCICVSVTDYTFNHWSHQTQLLGTTNVTEELFETACVLLEEMWDLHTPLRQIGVCTTQVSLHSHRQYNLFDGAHYDQLETLGYTVDQIRKKYGEDAIFRARFLNSEIPHMAGGLDKERRSWV